MRPQEREGGTVIEYPHQHILIVDGITRSCSSTSGYIKWVGGSGAALLPPPLLCVGVRVCEALLCARLAPVLDLANLAMAPALLTTGLIYAIMELIRVINSAQARARPGPYSQLWNCHNRLHFTPPPYPPLPFTRT